MTVPVALIAPVANAAAGGIKDALAHPPWTQFEEASKKQVEASKVMNTTAGLSPHEIARFQDLHSELEIMRLALEKRRGSWATKVWYRSKFSKYIEKVRYLVEVANVSASTAIARELGVNATVQASATATIPSASANAAGVTTTAHISNTFTNTFSGNSGSFVVIQGCNITSEVLEHMAPNMARPTRSPSRARSNSIAATRPSIIPGAPTMRSRANSTTRFEAPKSVQAALDSFESTHVFHTSQQSRRDAIEELQDTATITSVKSLSDIDSRAPTSSALEPEQPVPHPVPVLGNRPTHSRAMQSLRAFNVKSSAEHIQRRTTPRPVLLMQNPKTCLPISAQVASIHATAQIVCV